MDFRNDWLAKLGRNIDIPGLAFDEDGLCQLRVDSKWEVIIYRPTDTDDLLVLGQLPVSHLPAEVMQQMLVKNLSYRKRLAPILSLSESLNIVEIYFKFVPQEAEPVENIMGQLLDNLDYWHTHVNHV